MASLRPSLEMVTRDLRPSLMSLRSRKRNGSSEEAEDLISSHHDLGRVPSQAERKERIGIYELDIDMENLTF